MHLEVGFFGLVDVLADSDHNLDCLDILGFEGEVGLEDVVKLLVDAIRYARPHQEGQYLRITILLAIHIEYSQNVQLFVVVDLFHQLFEDLSVLLSGCTVHQLSIQLEGVAVARFPELLQDVEHVE